MPSIESSAKRSAWSPALPWVAIALGPLALFAPMLIRGRALFWGAPMLQFVPWRQAALEILSSGNLPLWNPWLGAGAPLLANHQSALLYPPNAILLVLDVAWGSTLLVLLHLIWAGAGMLLLGRKLGMGRLARTVAAVSFSLSGFLVARSGFFSINAAAAWLPWVVLGAEGLITPGRRARWRQCILGLAIPLGLQWLAGHAQMAWYSALLAGVWTLWRGRQRAGWKGAARAALGLLLAAAIAFALAAAQLIPTLEYLLHSSRSAGVDRELAFSYSFWPWRAFGLLAPDLFGNPARGDYWGFANYWEDAIYIGVLPLLMAIWGALAGRRSSKGLKWLLISVSLVALLLALGRNTPIFPFLYEHIPTFDLFQAPTRWNLLLVFCLSLLCAVGVDRWSAASARGKYWLRLGIAGAATITLTGLVADRVLVDLRPTFGPALAITGIWLAAAGVLALTRRDPAGEGWRRATLAIVILDLYLAGNGLNPSISTDLYHGRSSLSTVIGDDQRSYMPADLDEQLKFERAFRFDSFDSGIDWQDLRSAGLPNLTLLDGLYSANNFDPLLPERYQSFMAALDSAPPQRRGQLLDQLGVGWEAVFDGRSALGISYLPRMWTPRVALLPEAVLVGGPAAAELALPDPALDLGRQILIEGLPWDEQPLSGGPGQAILLETGSPNEVAVSAMAPQGGWLVLRDAWYPGWRASVDGEATEIYPANLLFRAVWVPPGEHQIEFQYRPFSFAFGAALSLTCWPLVLWLLRRWRANR